MKKKNRLFFLIALIVAAGIFGLVQFSTPFIFGADGNLHVQMASEIAEKGFLRTYPKAALSLFAGRFSDKDFLYHIYLIPFFALFGNPLGAKIASLTAVIVLIGCILSTLRGGSSWAYPVAASMLVVSAQFLRDMSESRPFTFAVALTVISVHFLINRRYKWLFLSMVLYGAFHLSAWAFLVFAAVYEFLRWLTGKDRFWGFWIALLGFFISFFLHPNFPNNIYYWYLNGILVPWYVFVGNFLEVGAEFFPLTTKEAVLRYPAIMLLGFSLLELTLAGIKLSSTRASGWLVASLVYLLFGSISTRNMTHAYPLICIAVVLIFRELLKGVVNTQEKVKDRVLSASVIVFLTVFFAGIYFTVPRITEMVRSDKIYADHFRRVAQYIQKNIPAGSRIFHTNWSDSQYLLGMAPEFEYLVTLDPIYMYAYNPDLYWQYRRISHATETDPAGKISDIFKAQYGYTNKIIFSPFYSMISSSPDFTIIAEDDIGAVFRLNLK